MATRLDGSAKLNGEFVLAVGAEVGYCLAGETKERTGTVVEIDDAFVTVRDAKDGNEVQIGKADSLRVLDVGARDIQPGAAGTEKAPAAPRKKTPAASAHQKRIEYQRRWRAKRRGDRPAGVKVCEKCRKPYKSTGHAQRFCPDCKTAGARVDRAAKKSAPTAAPQDNPQRKGGMVLVRVPRVPEVPAVPKRAASSANLDPYERAIAASPTRNLAADLVALAADCAAIAARVQALSEVLAG